jgi:dimethylaniline monooxygenase (N-oxide forming)
VKIDENQQWVIKGKNSESEFEERFDYLIVCSGTFSEPRIPQVEGMKDFISGGGKVIHTTQLQEAADYKRRRVAVIGFGKSACDVASAVADSASEVYLIYRQAKWKVPKKIMGINYKYFILSRFGEALTKLRYRSRAENIIHKLRIPSAAFPTFQKIFNRQQQLKQIGLYPDTTIQDQLFGELSVESDGFYRKVKEGKIKVIRAEIRRYDKHGVTLTDDTKLALDTVVYGTGFQQKLPLFSKEIVHLLTNERGDYQLYRNILPTSVPLLAFNGYNTSFFCTLTSEIAAQWIAEYLNGNLALPHVVDIEDEISEYHHWRRQFRLNSWYQGASVYPFNLTYVDRLLKDMNATLPWYLLFKEWTVVVDPGNYKGVKRRIRKGNGKVAGR